MDIETVKQQNLCAMKDFRNPENRQQYLQNAVNRNLLVQKLSAIKNEAEAKALQTESKLLEELIAVINSNDEALYSRLMRKYFLKRIA